MILTSFVFTSGVIWVFVSFLFVLSVVYKRNDLADVAWGPGIVLASWSHWYINGQSDALPTLLVLSLVTLWGARLGIRIGLKNWRKSEDPRYKRWREKWGAWFYPRSYAQVYLLQGALMVVMSSVVASIVLFSPGTYFLLTLLGGALVWFIGFVFEVVGDWQLDHFIKNSANRGGLMTRGLWRYSRHPNYFGEIVMWWGLAVIALASGSTLLALVSPLVITYLICFVSGIPLLEEHMSTKPGWSDYKKRTSVLLPLP